MGCTEEGFETTIVPQVRPSFGGFLNSTWIPKETPKWPVSQSLGFPGHWLVTDVPIARSCGHYLQSLALFVILSLIFTVALKPLLPVLITARPDPSTPFLPATTTVSLQLSGGWKKVSVDNYFLGIYQGKWLCTCHLQAICKFGSMFNCLFSSRFQPLLFLTRARFKPSKRAHSPSTPSFLMSQRKNNSGILLRGIVTYILEN